MSDRFEQAWRTFAQRDRTQQAPAHLETRVLAAVRQARVSCPPRPQLRSRWWLAAAAAVIAAIGGGTWVRPQTPKVLAATGYAPVMLPTAVAPMRPRAESVPGAQRFPTDARVVRADTMPLLLVIFDDTPVLPSEPLHLVRLRIPKDALSSFGVPLFDPDVEGTVDVDVLIGEDGLPRDVRKIRFAQEGRR